MELDFPEVNPNRDGRPLGVNVTCVPAASSGRDGIWASTRNRMNREEIIRIGLMIFAKTRVSKSNESCVSTLRRPRVWTLAEDVRKTTARGYRVLLELERIGSATGGSSSSER